MAHREVTVKWRSKSVTSASIEEAFRTFDKEYRGKEPDCGTGYVITWRRRRYPPKKILEIATKIPVGKFYGGRMTNDVFQKLGFHNGSFEDTNRSRLEARCPSLKRLVASLFEQKWQHLGTFDQSGESFVSAKRALTDSEFPGVYILAFPEESGSNLKGKTVRVKDVYYVGMSSIALATRLGQFRMALRNGRGHSAGHRVFEMDAKVKQGRSFFVASVSVPCRFRKVERDGADLRKLGTVASLEWHVLAVIKEKLQREPSLNKK